MFNKYNDSWISSASKNELRRAIDEVYDEMCKYDMFSPEYNKLSDLHDKLVTAWSTNPDIGGLPRHQHGWYLPEDDD
jgi:hypothetical protein